ncbi:YiiX/YebB-like N1pC/P60 family cysteine hydrolase [Paraburkholderia youngii]|uniref:YiiX/YebB-like N1pC/P60 family cysteine hydrolase n=1 Tax=Paraburkholderia youngii TaxID=2782701 RepID=UPI0035A19DA2
MKAGDVLLLASESLQSRAIGLLTGSDWSHAALAISSTEVVEAMPGRVGIRTTSLSQLLSRYSRVDVYSAPKNLSIDEKRLNSDVRDYQKKYRYSIALAGAAWLFPVAQAGLYLAVICAVYWCSQSLLYGAIATAVCGLVALLLAVVRPEDANAFLERWGFSWRVPVNETICSHLVVHLLVECARDLPTPVPVPRPADLPAWCQGAGFVRSPLKEK